MKLLCINTGIIKVKNTLHIGENLILGKIYTTEGEPFLDEDEQLCYFIKELQSLKLCCRFTKVIEPTKKEIIWSKKEELCLN